MGSGLHREPSGEIIKRKMAPIGRVWGEEKELEYLMDYLNSVVLVFNSSFSPFHAQVDKSGVLPQMYITRK